MKSRVMESRSGTRAEALEQGREAFRAQAWGRAYSHLSAADQDAPLDAEQVLDLAQAALLLGKETEGADLLARAHQSFLSGGDRQPAARCAFWLGFVSLLNGEAAKAGGWLSRAGRLLDEYSDCVEKVTCSCRKDTNLFTRAMWSRPMACLYRPPRSGSVSATETW